MSVPRRWPGETIVCLATGPSLTPEDVNFVRGKARVIAVKDAYRLAPWADALYGCDPVWWKWHGGVPTFAREKWSLDAIVGRKWRPNDRALFPDVQLLRHTGMDGLETDPSGIRDGRNSGYQAINLAVHYGAARVVLLGYDLQLGPQGAHFFGEHPDNRRGPYAQFAQRFTTLVAPLQAINVEVVNCSRVSRLKCFPTADLRAVFASAEVAA